MIKTYNQFINENFSFPNKITIEEFIKDFHFSEQIKNNVIDWWNKNRNRFNIHYFPFNTTEPICGVFIDENTIAVNSKEKRIPPEILLYIVLHESRHADQEVNDKFSERYFQTVLNDDKESFLKNYQELEKDANDFAVESMREMRFDFFIDHMEKMLRGNEKEGENVWKMMKADIEKFKVKSFSELLLKQIL